MWFILAKNQACPSTASLLFYAWSQGSGKVNRGIVIFFISALRLCRCSAPDFFVFWMLTFAEKRILTFRIPVKPDAFFQ